MSRAWCNNTAAVRASALHVLTIYTIQEILRDPESDDGHDFQSDDYSASLFNEGKTASIETRAWKTRNEGRRGKEKRKKFINRASILLQSFCAMAIQ